MLRISRRHYGDVKRSVISRFAHGADYAALERQANGSVIKSADNNQRFCL